MLSGSTLPNFRDVLSVLVLGILLVPQYVYSEGWNHLVGQTGRIS
jgi:hypothetical protein